MYTNHCDFNYTRMIIMPYISSEQAVLLGVSSLSPFLRAVSRLRAGIPE